MTAEATTPTTERPATLDVKLAGKTYTLTRSAPSYWQAAIQQIKQLRPDPLKKAISELTHVPTAAVAGVIAGALSVSRDNCRVTFNDVAEFEAMPEGLALNLQLRAGVHHGTEFKDFKSAVTFVLSLNGADLLALRVALAQLGE